MRWTMVDNMNEIGCRLTEIKLTWSMKCKLKEMTWDMNNEVWTKGNLTKHEQWRWQHNNCNVWYMLIWLKYSLQTYNFPLILKSYMERQNSSYQMVEKDLREMINYSNWCFWCFFHFLHFNVIDNKCHNQKWCMLFFTCIKTSATCAGMCKCFCMNQLEKTDYNMSENLRTLATWSDLYMKS